MFALNGTLKTEALRRAELADGDGHAYTVQFSIDAGGERLRWQLERMTPHDAAWHAPRAKLFVG